MNATSSASAVKSRRRHLVELEDLPWFPALFRDAGTAFLELASRAAGHSALLTPKTEEALQRSGATRIIGLCAGGGGPLTVMSVLLRERGWKGETLLTDLYPNLSAMKRLEAESGGALRAWTAPVDATAVPHDLEGLRVICNAFHHLDRPAALKVLQDTVKAGQPIAIFEVVSREPLPLFGISLAPLTFSLALPFLRPFRWAWIPFTYLLPLIPAFVLWDGVVSWLRIWSEGELHELVNSLDAPGWTWDIGLIKLGNAPANATYLVGYPPRVDPVAT